MIFTLRSGVLFECYQNCYEISISKYGIFVLVLHIWLTIWLSYDWDSFEFYVREYFWNWWRIVWNIDIDMSIVFFCYEVLLLILIVNIEQYWFHHKETLLNAFWMFSLLGLSECWLSLVTWLWRSCLLRDMWLFIENRSICIY